MNPAKTLYNPFIHKRDSTTRVMTDVIIALIPCIVMTWVAYGYTPIITMLVAIASCMLTEYLFNFFLRRDTNSLGDSSAIVTGILLAFTIGPFTPLYIVAIGGGTAILFGKMLWGGLGRNRFNPALTGREFMVVLFPSVMNSSGIWKNEAYENITSLNLFDNRFWDNLIYSPTGAMGEYSPLLLVVGGIYLLWRHRISWHIPVALLVSFSILLFIFGGDIKVLAFGGLFLGTIYMATDMPTSSSSPAGKLYYGAMVGITAIICLLMGAYRGYFSYSILILNAFVVPINWVFRTRTWGRDLKLPTRLWQGALLTIAIFATLSVVLWLHHHEALIYPVMAYAVYSILRFICSKDQIPWARIRKTK